MYRSIAFIAGMLLLMPAGTRGAAESPGAGSSAPAPMDGFNYVIGTQTFSPAYHFTRQPSLLETAEAIRDMGATVIKFEGSPRYKRRYGVATDQLLAIRSLTELAREEPAHRKVLDMPFAYYVLWAHTFSLHGDTSWRNGFPKEAQDREYREMYDFVAYLLKTYSGSGKTFYLGHWEGDGWLRGSARVADDVRVTPEAVQGMVDWLNTRQRAVDDAKRDTPHQNVQVWHYTEVNHVKVAMQGHKAVVNEVLPKTTVDYVSYSSYDTARDPQELAAALDFIESKLPAKAGVPGKRVWLGEYGFPSIKYSPSEQDALSRRVMRVGLQWGCPFVLYWEMYNNEVDDQGKQRGFWLINDKGVKQPIYHTHQDFYAWARRYVAATCKNEGRAPTSDAFRKAAVAHLDEAPAPVEKRSTRAADR